MKIDKKGTTLPLVRTSIKRRALRIDTKLGEIRGIRRVCANTGPRSHEGEDCTKAPIYRLQPATCSPEFRELILTRYPILRTDVALCRFVGYLLLNPHYPEEGRISLWAKLLADIEDKQRQYRQCHYRAWQLLERLRKHVFPLFEYDNSNYLTGRCRTVRVLGLPKDVEEAVAIELRSRDRSVTSRVFFENGRLYNRRARRGIRENARAVANIYANFAAVPQTKRVVRHMNSLPPNRFFSVLEHIPAALDYAERIENPKARTAALQNVRAIEDQPQPFYKAAVGSNAARAFPASKSLLTVKREIRKLLTPHWTECDLATSQLAINASRLQNKVVLDILNSGTDPWAVIFDHLQLDEAEHGRSRLKKPIKEVLYALHYGMSNRNARRELNRSFLAGLCDDPGGRFLDIPMVDSIIRHRNVEIERITDARGDTDCFGVWHPLKGEDRFNTNVLAILAYVAQATELQILLPVFDLAESTNDFDIVLWQHDGFSVAFSDASKAERWLRRICSAVDAEAAWLGIPTHLEVG